MILRTRKLSIALGSLVSAFSQNALSQNAFLDSKSLSEDGVSLATEHSFLEENPYVKLYRKRLEVAHLQVKSQMAVAENERVKWLRMQALVEKGAVPLNDAEDQQKRWKMAAKRVEILKSKSIESKALFDIAKQRTDAGIDMPVCSVSRFSNADSQPSQAPVGKKASFAWLNENLFSKSCLSCHNATYAPAGVDLSSYESLLQSSRFPRLVSPFKPDESFVLKVVENGLMPLGPNKIDSQTALSLREWILTGARKNESDPAPVPTPVPTEPPDL